MFHIRAYPGKLVRTLRREEKAYLYDYTPIQDPGSRFENLIALHLYKLCYLWTDFGFGNFDLFYVRDREKREVDFLITEQNKPFVLMEAKLKARDIDPSLRYFKERLKPKHSVQIVRNPERFTKAFYSDGILIVPAAQALAIM